MAIYTDSLQNGWADWSWSATRNFGNTSPVHSGSSSISVTFTAGWAGLSLHHANINASSYTDLRFWINGGASGGQQLWVYAEAPDGTSYPQVSLSPLTATNWQQITLSLSSLGIANRPDFARFTIQDHSGAAAPTFYVDDITLITNSTPPPYVTLTSPADGSSYAAPATINLAATVTPNGHTITKVQFYSNGTNLLNEDTTSPYSYTWNSVGVGSYSLTARVVYDSGATADSGAANVSVTGTTPVSINVDAQVNRHAINPFIYGVAFASTSELLELNAPLNRSGGNNETRYNWLIDAHNHGADWYFESLADGDGTPGASADTFVSQSQSGGAEPMLTIPMIGWTCKLGASRARLASFSTNKYGPQTDTDWQWFPQAGNGIGTNYTTHAHWVITTNDPNDANFPTNSVFQAAFVRHLTNTWGVSTNGGVRYYFMDNEHSIWHSTHRDIHPVGATMAEIRDKMIDYGGTVKSNDPGAIVLGPEEWGWSGYFYSGYDQQNSGFHDRANNGGWDYMPWLLNQLHQHDTNTGQRLLDYFTVHCYPQGGEFSQSDVSTSMQLLRNKSTRQFWDTNYVDQSWIGQQAPPNNILRLIPRMKGWVDTYYPGTKIGITEYNWGAESHINGATAQADIFGIFGREGLDVGTRWTTPGSSSPTFKAMKMYRNYDGNDSTFGDTSVADVVGTNVDYVSSFAAERSSDGALTVMVINKQLTAGAALTLSLANFTATNAAQVWQLTSANVINHLSDVAVSGNAISTTVPAQSITLFVVPPGGAIARPPDPALSGARMTATNTITFWLTNGVAGLNYVIVSTTDLANPTASWPALQTNTLTSSSNNYVFPASDTARFYRAMAPWPQ